MALPDQLLLSDLLRHRVRCDRGLDHGSGVIGWMHPPVHRLLGWVTRPAGFGRRRLVWRLDQLRDLNDLELLVVGDPAETDPDTLERLPTLLEAALLGQDDRPLGSVVDAAVELRSGRIRHYLVSRSDPRLPGSSRWRLSPDRIVDQQPGRVFTALRELDDLPLARASVRQAFLQRSRRWRQQLDDETSRLRDQVQQVGDRFEERIEGWLEERPWEPEDGEPRHGDAAAWRDGEDDPLEHWPDSDHEPSAERSRGGRRGGADRASAPMPRRSGSEPSERYRGRDGDDDPWI
ncbi:MAG: RNA methyltransferase [Synechococcaceae cyanobacterium]